MAKMRITFARTDLPTLHTERAVGLFGHVLFCNRFGETGPACAAVEFVQRSKEWFAIHNIDINSSLMIVPVLIPKCGLRAALLRDVVLLRGEPLAEFFSGGFRILLVAG